MDVPFSSSGAMSRAHYALVRKIETASPQAADQILLAEVQSIRHQLARSTLTLKQCKECLVLLLYCTMAMNPGVTVDIEFALPYAINLAEAGQTIQDKRTGYMFCAEVMPPEHELQLMLVNSTRKDLESSMVPRICLALDTLIQTPSKDVIPAVQSRLHDLLSHNSLHVRRRALLAFHRLSEQDPEVVRDVIGKVRKRLNDADPVVISAALTLADTLVKTKYLAADKYHVVVSGVLDALRKHSGTDFLKSKLLCKVIGVLERLGPSAHDLTVMAEIVRDLTHAGPSAYAIIQQCFHAVAVAPNELLLEVQTSSGISFVREIRHLLTSKDPNALYVFVCCLSLVDPGLWAGTNPEIPAVLEEWEVERVMQLLESEDRLIRKQTLRTLWRVDQSVVESYYARALQGNLPSSSLRGDEDNLPRLLEILDIMCGDNGEAYTHQLKNVLKAAEGDGPINRRPIFQEAVEEMLSRIHAADSAWRSGCIGVLFTSIIDAESDIGPTLMVILTALFCEYLELSPISPPELLRGLATRLPFYAPSIQDACLVTMLRMSAASDTVPSEAWEAVKELHAHSGRHIQRRCDQFTTLSRSKENLARIIASTHASSLPEFVMALERYEAAQQRAHSSRSRSPSLFPSSPSAKRHAHTPDPPPSSRGSPTPGKLRYAAYEPPRPTPRLRRMSSGSSRHSDDGASSRNGSVRAYQDPLSMTVTPGDLSIAAQTSDLRSIPSSSPRQTGLSPLPIVQILDEEPPTDLIALDSPFITEPQVPSIASTLSSVVEQDFEATWNAFESGPARGWCESSIDVVLRRLQGLQRRLRVTERDRPPFEGDLKVVICPELGDATSNIGLAAIRLKESDDDSCLWWLRCEDEQLRNVIKATLR